MTKVDSGGPTPGGQQRATHGVSRHAPLFAAAALGGALASLTSFPLPWLIGSLVASAAAHALSPRPQPPKQSRMAGQLILGAAVALSLTPAALASLTALAPLIVATAFASIGLALVAAMVMTNVSRVDRITAYFACMPGGLAEMSTLADRFGGDAPLVALAQSIRIVLVVVTIPIALHGYGDWFAPTTAAAERPTLGWLQTALILGGGLAIARLFDRVRLMNSWFLGGLAFAGALAASDLLHGAMPAVLAILGQVLIGATLGARFDVRELRRYRAAAPVFALGTLAMIVINGAAAALLSLIVTLDLPTLVLAMAPGGVAEMSITAASLDASVAAVVAFHLVRIVLIVLLSGKLYESVFSRTAP